MNRRGDELFAGGFLFCVGCNQSFRSSDMPPVCPVCGQAGDASAGDDPDSLASAQTMLLTEAGTGQSRRAPTVRGGMDPLIGRRLHVYECMSLIGSGGMGRVYLATHSDLQRRCALKILAPRSGSPDQDYVDRFVQEGRAAAALVHPNVVTVHAVGQVEGHHYLEMEFIAGRSLQQLLRDERQLDVTRGLTLAALIADGLAAAHRDGIIHRDVKPDNVMLTRDGVPKISDFGLAKRVLGKDGRPVRDGLCGTPNFMAPELFEGHDATPASDVYALGITLFQMLTGRLPHHAQTLADLLRVGRSTPLPNIRSIREDISLEVASTIAAMTATVPAHRPANGAEAGQLLYAVLGHERDLESLVIEAFRHELGVSWTRTGDRFTIRRHLPGDRHQDVFLEPSQHGVDDRLLVIYSVCCPAQLSFYEAALRLNSRMLHGSVSIRDLDGAPHFVVSDTYPRATVDPEEIRRSVLEVAVHADSVEQILTSRDRN